MNDTIWKFSFDVADVVTLHVPGGARFLPLVHATSPERLEVWAEVDSKRPSGPRTLRIVGTGHPLAGTAGYVGSVVATPFVWHVYEAAVQ